jgi:NAD(P)-dependent dehydrogenase (short-subunit alcohol dehydrogenase family)
MTNPMDLHGKAVLVTGASSGIGREASRCLSELGARVVLVGRNKEKLLETASSLEGTGHLVEAFDLSQIEETPAWLENLSKVAGPLDGLVHCAGVILTQPIRAWNLKETEALMRINVYAGLALARIFRQKSAHKPGASLVFMSSIAALNGQPGLVTYAASKGAIIGLTKSLALELVRDGVRVNCIAAGTVDTEMLELMKTRLTSEQIKAVADKHPLGFGRPRDVANAIAFLVSDASRWITGSTLVVDGGCTA